MSDFFHVHIFFPKSPNITYNFDEDSISIKKFHLEVQIFFYLIYDQLSKLCRDCRVAVCHGISFYVSVTKKKPCFCSEHIE